MLEHRQVDDNGSQQMPMKQLRRERREKRLSLERIEVPDPDRPGRTTHVDRNRRIDILVFERSHGHLSAAAYLVGCIIQHVFENGRSISLAKSPWRVRVDVAPRIEPTILRALDKAKKRCLLEEWLIGQVGKLGADFLRRVLADGWTYADLARQRGGDTGENRAFAAKRFRAFLEDLAYAWRVDPPDLLTSP